jgi:GTP-binding protein
LLGRSNVGKSSFINKLCGRKGLAKTSNTPGKTRMMNFYQLNISGGGQASNTALTFIDLPGYGYAKVSKTEQEKWSKEFEQLLSKREGLAVCVQLIDSRHGMQPNDETMLEWLLQQKLSPMLVLTKADKLSRSEAAASVLQLAKKLEVDPSLLHLFSAESGQGTNEVWQAILEGVRQWKSDTAKR